MIKRWQRCCKVKIKVPWPSGEKVSHIDLSIRDLSILWGNKLPPSLSKKTVKILAEKIITQEQIEYYVEIPLQKLSDFLASDHFSWQEGVTEGKVENGCIIIKVEPVIIWQYRNEENKIKMENFILLEGEVIGEFKYTEQDGSCRYHRIRKDLWAKLPDNDLEDRVIILILTNWRCSPLPNWNWEQGEIWCEIALDLLSFPLEANLQGGE